MNSTENDAMHALLGALFDDVLMPIATGIQARGEQPFPLKPDVSWLSYYVRRRRSTTTAADFTSASCRDIDEFEQRLAAHWQGLGRHALAAQVAQFGAVARATWAARGNEPAKVELSPYVYVMF